MSFAAAGLISASLVLLPLAFYVEGPPAVISQRSLWGVLYLALLPTGAATIMLTLLIRRAGPPFLSLVNYQVPVWAVLIGVVILAEALPGHFITALAIILGGVAISQFVGRSRAVI
jgi:drug/metabolite transporter (DMT)-like permease